MIKTGARPRPAARSRSSKPRSIRAFKWIHLFPASRSRSIPKRWLEQIAEVRGRPVDEVFSELLDRYILRETQNN